MQKSVKCLLFALVCNLLLIWTPPAGAVLGLLALGLLLSAVVGPIAAVYAAVKISRAETYVTMREGE